MKSISVRLEEELYNYIDNLAVKDNVSHSVVLRKIIRQVVTPSAEVPLGAPAPHPMLEKTMLSMTLQILGLARLLASQVNASAIHEAIEKSDKVVDEFYRNS